MLSKAYICSRVIAGVASSNPAEGLDVRFLFVVCCVGSGLCDQLFTGSEEPYRLCVSNCVLFRILNS
jgi:hypothetical protein